jgi:gluconokinase
MPVSLLESQFETLEEPGADEHPIVIAIDRRPDEIVTEITTALAASGCLRR